MACSLRATLRWQISSKTEGIDDILPAMRTDVVLDHGGSGRRIVIDTKFTSIVTAGVVSRAKPAQQLHLPDVRLSAVTGRLWRCTGRLGKSGLLLHPAVGTMVDETVVIQGHPLRFATVDLAAKPAEIRAQLLKCVEVPC